MKDEYIIRTDVQLKDLKVGDEVYHIGFNEIFRVSAINSESVTPIVLHNKQKYTWSGEAVKYSGYRVLVPVKKRVPFVPTYHGEPLNTESAVEHPNHYNVHPSGVECITIIQEFPLNIGTSIKFLWRAGLKPHNPIKQDLLKAIEYINFELKRIEAMENTVIEHFKDD